MKKTAGNYIFIIISFNNFCHLYEIDAEILFPVFCNAFDEWQIQAKKASYYLIK